MMLAYGCMYHALMRPAEVAALTIGCCNLPEDPDTGDWLIFADSWRRQATTLVGQKIATKLVLSAAGSVDARLLAG